MLFERTLWPNGVTLRYLFLVIGEVSWRLEDFSAEVAEMFFAAHPVRGGHVNIEVALTLEVLATLFALVVLEV